MRGLALFSLAASLAAFRLALAVLLFIPSAFQAARRGWRAGWPR